MGAANFVQIPKPLTQNTPHYIDCNKWLWFLQYFFPSNALKRLHVCMHTIFYFFYDVSQHQRWLDSSFFNFDLVPVKLQEFLFIILFSNLMKKFQVIRNKCFFFIFLSLQKIKNAVASGSNVVNLQREVERLKEQNAKLNQELQAFDLVRKQHTSFHISL